MDIIWKDNTAQQLLMEHVICYYFSVSKIRPFLVQDLIQSLSSNVLAFWSRPVSIRQKKSNFWRKDTLPCTCYINLLLRISDVEQESLLSDSVTILTGLMISASQQYVDNRKCCSTHICFCSSSSAWLWIDVYSVVKSLQLNRTFGSPNSSINKEWGDLNLSIKY